VEQRANDRAAHYVGVAGIDSKLTAAAAHASSRRSDLCVEWDVKLYSLFTARAMMLQMSAASLCSKVTPRVRISAVRMIL